MTRPSEEYCRFRIEMRDTNDPPLFCDDFIKFAYNEAERQAAQIGKLLFDRTSHVCNIPLLAGVNSYRLDETVFEVARMSVFDGTTRWTAKVRDLYEYDMLQPDWRGMDFSVTKSVFVYDSTIEIAGNCDFDGTLNLECYRLPLQKASDADQFEISAQHHPHLIDYAKYLAYQTRDADVEQTEYAKIHEERFRAYFSDVAAAAEAARSKQRKHEVGPVVGQARTPEQLVNIFLAESGDKSYQNKDGRMLDAGWERSLLLMYADEAEREAAARASLIFDSETENICKIAVAAGQSKYQLSELVVRVCKCSFVKPDGSVFSIEVRYSESEDIVNNGNRTKDFLENRVVYIREGELSCQGNVSVVGYIMLEVYRYPKVPASSVGNFEITSRHHLNLLHYIKYKAYMSVDNDVFHELASYHERKFIDIYGSKKTESLVNRESIRYLRTNKRWY